MAIRIAYKETEKTIYSEDILWDNPSTRINFNLSDNETIIFIHADGVADSKFRSSVEISVAELLCDKINKDAKRLLVGCTSNTIKIKSPHVYFRVLRLDKSTRIEIYERELKVGIA